MSIPVRAADGCMVGSRLNRYTFPPLWLYLGKSHDEYVYQCPQHTLQRTETEIKTPWSRVIGTLVKHKLGSIYCKVTLHKDRNYFLGKDVFCDECKEWHFTR